VKWSAKEYEIELPSNTGTVLCLKKAIEIQTGVLYLQPNYIDQSCIAFMSMCNGFLFFICIFLQVKIERQKLLNLKFKG